MCWDVLCITICDGTGEQRDPSVQVINSTNICGACMHAYSRKIVFTRVHGTFNLVNRFIFDHLKLMQVVVEIPYVLLQAICYTLIVYSMVGFECTATKFLWFFFFNFFTFLYFIYYGMMTVSVTPNHQLAAILSSAFFSLFNLFSGFYIPKPVSNSFFFISIVLQK